MEIYNDDGFGLGWIVTSVEPPKLCASIAIKGTFRLAPGKVAERVQEQDGLRGDETVILDDPNSSLRYSSDLVPMKPKVDLLFAATCYTPGGQPRSVCPVFVRVGDWSKTLVAMGDRFSKRGIFATLSEPQPFSAMPIVYERTYGGAGFAANPTGTGRSAEIGPDGSKLLRLPNVVAAHQDHKSREIRLDSEPGAEDAPSGFAPLKETWDPRRRKVGTYGGKWLRERWPWVPENFDWTYHNTAPEDQQIDTLKGDEPIVFENLHAEHPLIEAQLPGLRMRVFVEDTDPASGQAEFKEVDVVLDTLWAEPGDLKLSLVWRGQTDVASPKMENLTVILVACEPLSKPPLPKEEYEKKLEAERKKEEEEAAADEAEDQEREKELEDTLAKQAEERAAHMAEFDMDMADLDARFAAAEGNAAKILETAADPVAAAGGDPAALAEPGVFLTDKQIGEAYKTNMDRLGEFEGFAAPEMPAAEDMAVDPAKLGGDPAAASTDEGAGGDQGGGEGDDAAGGGEPPADAAAAGAPPADEKADEEDDGIWTREKVEKHAGEKGSFDEQDLSGLDLSGLTLSNLSFVEADLAGTNFSNAKLDGAVLTEARMSEANFSGADLSGADLAETTCSRANFDSAVMNEVTLEGADAANATFRGTEFKALLVKNAILTETTIEGSTIDGWNANGADFSQARLADLTIDASDFEFADFTEATLERVRVQGSRFVDASIDGANATGIVFVDCDISKLRADSKADFSNADMRECIANESIWDESNLSGANFSGAELERASFTDCNLSGAKFLAANLPNANLEGTNMTDALFTRANLFRASFERARMAGASLLEANAYEAEFLEADLEGAKFTGANVEGTKLAR